MGWYGVRSALSARDEDELAAELSPRRNPSDPLSALELAVRQMSETERAHALTWADAWLREPQHDVLRARGDHRWRAMVVAERMLRTQMTARNTGGST